MSEPAVSLARSPIHRALSRPNLLLSADQSQRRRNRHVLSNVDRRRSLPAPVPGLGGDQLTCHRIGSHYVILGYVPRCSGPRVG